MFKVTIKPITEIGKAAAQEVVDHGFILKLGNAFRHFLTFKEAEEFARPFVDSKDHDVQISWSLAGR
jgi:hypothetical protein|tara:strand:- start:65 stop:265 length:201 start_codon:yes stop_codon:yes gene_type:complete